MNFAELTIPTSRVAFGRSFVNPVVDVLFVCGGFTFPLLLLAVIPNTSFSMDAKTALCIFVFFNYAHFASSSVRLYTKPGAVAEHRFLAYGFPIVAIVIVMIAIAAPELIGRNFIALYLTWSPYHYAAQAYGLALMYCYRSGIVISAGEKRCLWWICMLPFLRALVNPYDHSVAEVMGVRGIAWLIPEAQLGDGSPLATTLDLIVVGLTPFVFLLPIAFAFVGKLRLPLMPLVLILMNAAWLVVFSYFEAAVWATVAHSLQYLIIVSYVHGKDATASTAANAGHGMRYHVFGFYLFSIVLGVILFLGVPLVLSTAEGWLGQGWDFDHCFLMMVAGINLHHFIVDGYIWRSKRPKVHVT